MSEEDLSDYYIEEKTCECTYLRTICDKIFPCVVVPGRQPVPNSLWRRLWYEGTYPNTFVKKIVGFVVGLLASQLLLYIVLIFFRTPPTRGVISCFIVATILPIGLALSAKVRCIFALVIPTLCSDKGQALIIAYMLTGIIEGPMEQFSYNAQVFALSSVCGQDKLLKAKEETVQAAKQPIIDISNKVENVVTDMKKVAKKMEEQLDKAVESFDNVVDKIAKIKEWLQNVESVCNRKFKGSSSEFCQYLRDGFVNKCVNRLWSVVDHNCPTYGASLFDAICDAAAASKETLCNIDLNIDLGIDLPGLDIDLDFDLKAPFADTRRKIKEKVAERKRLIKEFFAYNVTFFRNESSVANQSRTYKAIARDIRDELLERVRIINYFLRVTQFALVSFFLMVIVVSCLYLRKYHKKIRCDNFYINSFIKEVDAKRMQLHPEKESIFPMTLRERFTYISPWSLKVTDYEINKILVNLLKLIPLLVNLLVVIVCDIGLWYALNLTKSIFQIDYDTGIQAGEFETKVEGDGPIGKSFNEIDPIKDDSSEDYVDDWNCVPFPAEPDWELYRNMRNFAIYLLLMALFQGYVLRLRPTICSMFYPKRARERAIYLYSEILQTRGGLLSYLKKQAKLRLLKHENIEKVSLCQRLGASMPLLRPILNALGYAQKYCIGCGQAGPVKDMENFIHCRNYGCKAIYCKTCTNDLKNTCTECNKPIDFSFVEVDEELDSSDEEAEGEKQKVKETPEQKKLKTVQQQGDILKRLLVIQKEKQLAVTGEVV